MHPFESVGGQLAVAMKKSLSNFDHIRKTPDHVFQLISISIDQTFNAPTFIVWEQAVTIGVKSDWTPMNRPLPTSYSETEARARSGKTLNDAGRDPCRSLKMTATMKRRALKKRPSKLNPLQSA
jgi:hypothetical protein